MNPGTCTTSSPNASQAVVGERREAPREPLGADLWMVDHQGSTVLKARCEEVSSGGMRLRVPLGYGVANGQRYEMRTQVPGARPARTNWMVGSRWATVVRTNVRIDQHGDHLEVALALDPLNASAIHFTRGTPGRA